MIHYETIEYKNKALVHYKIFKNALWGLWQGSLVQKKFEKPYDSESWDFKEFYK